MIYISKHRKFVVSCQLDMQIIAELFKNGSVLIRL